MTEALASEPARRQRDAEATRRALLEAAQALFGQRGFDATTVREIGERAAVDPALIARYFGSKADLYVAAMVAETTGEAAPLPYRDLADMAKRVLARTETKGLGPITQALVRADTADPIRRAAQDHLVRRLVEPLEAEHGANDSGGHAADNTRAQAELVVAALLGVNLARGLGWFEELSALDLDDLVARVVALLSP